MLDERPGLSDRAPGYRYAYGLALTGLSEVGDLSSCSADGGMAVRVRVSQRDSPAPSVRDLDERSVVRRLADGHILAMDKDSGTASLYGTRATADRWAHPLLSPVAVTFNRWHGREAYHAGCFVAGDRAWILVGHRNAGKSTLLAALAASGTAVLSDDIVVTDGTFVHAGPRCVDLRQRLPGVSAPLRTVRDGTRLRLGLDPAPSRVRLRGWIFLGWDASSTVVPVAAGDLLQRVAARRLQPAQPSDPTTLLRLATLPAWDVRRPREWTSLGSVVAALTDLTTRTAAGSR